MNLTNLEIEIELEDVRLILGDRFQKVFAESLQQAHCPSCQKVNNAILDIKKIWLNNVGDIIVDGWCKDCSLPIERYVDSGIYPDAYDQAMALRELKIDVLKDYNVRL